MTPEIEAEIRRRVEEFKARGKRLQRGSYACCLIGAYGGTTVANRELGEVQARALENGFEGYDQGGASKTHPDYYELGLKIFQENVK